LSFVGLLRGTAVVLALTGIESVAQGAEGRIALIALIAGNLDSLTETKSVSMVDTVRLSVRHCSTYSLVSAAAEQLMYGKSVELYAVRLF